jgi:uncharacterized protein YjaZ
MEAVNRKNLKSTSVNVLQNLMFGGDGVPQWAGYTIGFNIVQSYIKRRSQLDVNVWTALDPEKTWSESNYSAAGASENKPAHGIRSVQ